jgi:hypothetical protein
VDNAVPVDRVPRVSNLSPDGRWRWDGRAWVPAQKVRTAFRWWQVALAGLLPWLVFEVVLVLVPVWAPDESYSLRGVLVTLPIYGVIVGSPGVIFGALTQRTSVLIVGTIVLCGAAAWSAIAMVASDDGQAGLAVFLVWYAGVALIVLTLLANAVFRSRPG